MSEYQKVRSAYWGMNIQDIPSNDIEETIFKILRTGYGYNMESLFKNTAKYGYGWQRTGKNIKARFNTVLKRLLNKKKIIIDNGIIKIKE